MKEDVLPEGWEIKKLESLADILDFQRKPINSKEREKRIQGKSDNKLFPYYGATGEVGKIDDYLFNEELVALGEDGVPFLDFNKDKAYMLYGKTWVNNHAHVLRAKKGITENKFLYYFLNQFDYRNYVNGGIRLKLTQANMRKIPVITPPLPEQQYLSQKLTALLDEVAQTKQRLEAIPALLKKFRQSVLADAVSGRLTEENADKWNTQPLKSLTTKIGSGSTPKGGNDVYKDSGIPFVRSLNIHTHFIKYEDLVFIDEVQAEKLKNVKIEENDVLLNITGASIGRVNIAPKEFVNGRVNQHVAIIRLKQEALLPTFLHLVLASPKFQKWIEGENYGTTRQALTKGMLEILEIHYPDIATQTQIVQKVETYFALPDEIETQVKAALENVNLFTQSILAKAFSGELSAAWRKENSQLIQIRNNNE